MRKRFTFVSLCFVALMGLMVASCGKEDVITPDTNDSTPVNDTIPEEPTYTIIGSWALDEAFQDVSGNIIDVTPFYGLSFQLTFEEGGRLLVSDGNNVSEMQWTLDGDQLAFIQAPGVDPVVYHMTVLDAEKLTIVNGEGTGYVTTMNLHRI